MGLEFKIDTENGVIHSVGHGGHTVQDLFDHCQMIRSHPDYKESLVHLLDYRDVAVIRSTPEAFGLARFIFSPKVAVVAGESSYGSARMVHGWVGNDSLFMVFHDMASAREWLGLPPDE